jgi:hypothetical protein
LQVAEHEERMEELRLQLRALAEVLVEEPTFQEPGPAAEVLVEEPTFQEPGPAPGNRCPICNRIILGDGGAPGEPCFTCWQRQRDEGGGDGGAGGAGGGGV